MTQQDNDEGLDWHVRHKNLYGWCFSEEGRKAYIRQHKPIEEQETRLRLMKRIIGPIPPMLIRLCKEASIAGRALDAAQKTRLKARGGSWGVQETYDKTLQTWLAVQEKLRSVQEICQPEMERLHAVECPDCPWNGETIFPGSE